MQKEGKRIFGVVLAWVSTTGVVAHLLAGFARQPRPLDRSVVFLGLLAAAAATAALASTRHSAAIPRLTATFLLVAFVHLQSPAAVLLGMLALAAGRGGGLTGFPGIGIRRGAASAVAVLTVDRLGALFTPEPIHPALLLAWMCVLWSVLQAAAAGTTFVLEFGERPDRAVWRLMALESSNVPIAWLLIGMLERGAWLQSAALGLLVIAAQAVLMRSSAAESELDSSRRELAARLKELRTLNTLGRAILESPEPGRVCAVIDSECRKIFDVEHCTIAMADPQTGELREVHRRRRGMAPDTDPVPLDDRFVQWVEQSGVGLRIDDLEREPGWVKAESGMRSALVAPLVVEDRLLGLVTIQTWRPAAYDDHQLAVLTTIAHQAAVALESAHHYQRATIDSLTGCFLRDYFFERLAEEHERSERYGGVFSVLMLDLDGFKQINDRHGHLAGDSYLREVGATIRAQLRAADIACRYGGDEFSLLLPETDLEGAKVIAERIRLAIAMTGVAQSDVTLRSTASIGIAVYPQHRARDIHGLLRNADEALYRAKRAGRDCVVPFAA